MRTTDSENQNAIPFPLRRRQFVGAGIGSALTLLLAASPTKAVASPGTETTETGASRIVEQPWDQIEPWVVSGPGSGSVGSGALQLASNGTSGVTRARLADVDVPAAYSVSTMLRVEAFGAENGMSVYDGSHRLMLYFTQAGISVRNITGEGLDVVRWSSDTGQHRLRIDVVDGQARLFMDNVDRGSFALQESDGPDSLEYWVAGGDQAALVIDETTLSPYEPLKRSRVVFEDGLEELDSWTVEGAGSAAHRSNGTHLRGDVTVSQNMEIPDRYTLAWSQRVMRAGKSQVVRVGNGKQRLELRLENGRLLIRDQENEWQAAGALDAAPGTWHKFLVTVDKGFAQLAVDDVGYTPEVIALCASDEAPGVALALEGRGASTVVDGLRLVDVGTEPSAFASYLESFEDGAFGAFQERSPSDAHSFSPGAWQIAAGTANSVLHAAPTDEATLAALAVLGRDVSFAFRVRITDVIDGGQLVVFARRSAVTSYLAAIYDVDSQRWSIQEQEYQDVPVQHRAVSAPMALGVDWVEVRLEVARNRAELYVGGLDEPLLAANNIHRRGRGNVGWQVQGVGIDVDDVEYHGESRPSPGITAMSGFDYDNASNILRLSNGYLVMPGADGVVWESRDGSQKWEPIGRDDRYEKLQALSVVLKGGAILSAQRTAGDEENEFRYRTWRSEDDGRTWQGPFDVNQEWKNRITMGGKLVEVEGGRIFFPSGESGHAQEEFGGVWIYYSDDGGRTWTESTTRLDWETFGVNLQETSIIELSDASLKAISRSDGGYLMESLSVDGGVSWSSPTNIPGLHTSLCAFSLDRDRETGDIYLFWEYTNPADSMTAPQMPRNRAAVAVSRDDTATWQFLADVDDFMVDGDEENHHMNQSLTFDEGQLWLTAARQDKGGHFGLYAWHVDLDKLGEGGPLPGVHDLVSYR